jgi:hypothetical protein
MRVLAGVLLLLVGGGLTGCAASDGGYEAPAEQTALDRAWTSLRPGDTIVMIPGTGAVEYLAKPIEAMGGTHPLVDVLADETVKSDAVVFEQAIGMAHRAGISDDDIQNGAVKFLLWGTGITKITGFDYVGYERLTVPVEILGGTNSAAIGGITENYLNYTKGNADIDARDVYSRLQAWLTDHPTEHVVVASHSWGGAVGEYLTLERDAIEADLGALPGGTTIPFTIADGVPGFIVGYNFIGPGVRDMDRSDGKRTVYEIDRPDDPVHEVSFDGDFGGHHYNIVWNGEFRGSYGITTEDLSCHEVPGPCAMP